MAYTYKGLKLRVNKGKKGKKQKQPRRKEPSDQQRLDYMQKRMGWK